jgi:hypothetical protein
MGAIGVIGVIGGMGDSFYKPKVLLESLELLGLAIAIW